MINLLTTRDPTSQYPTTFFTADKLLEFWQNVKWFMKYNMPIFMIVAAVFVVYMVIIVIIDVVADARNEQRRSDEDDIDVKYY